MPSILINLLAIEEKIKKLQMDSFIVEDVNALLKIKKGDAGRLEHIKELCETNQIVSLSDRKYVERLGSQYLRKIEQKSKSRDKPKFVPIEDPSISNFNISGTYIANNQTEQLEEVQISEPPSPKKTHSESFDLSQNKKIVFGIGAIALAIILIAVVAVGYDSIQSTNDSETIKSNTLAEFALETDESAYETADIISISGHILSYSSEIIRITVENENGKLIWAENLNLKNNGEFSTLLIAGGSGWENSGKYILNAEYEDLKNQISFDFTAKK